jgi:hypothetical protein
MLGFRGTDGEEREGKKRTFHPPKHLTRLPVTLIRPESAQVVEDELLLRRSERSERFCSGNGVILRDDLVVGLLPTQAARPESPDAGFASFELRKEGGRVGGEVVVEDDLKFRRRRRRFDVRRKRTAREDGNL